MSGLCKECNYITLMSTDEFIKKMNDKIAKIEKENEPLKIAVRSIMSLQSKRIFLKAQNSDNSVIGIYKGGEIWVNPTKEPYNRVKKIATKGKTGESKFENGQPHKTGYFKNWLNYKKAVGRNKTTLNVDLFLTGDLHRNWANAKIGAQAQAIKINQHNYLTRLDGDNFKKVERYGRVFNLSIFERKEFLRVLQIELVRALK